MKEKRLFLPDKWLFSLLFWLLCSTFLFAQNNTSYLTWDQQVGCINYDNEYDIKRNRLILNENVEEAPCLQFCQYSKVNFKLNGNNIAHVEWEVNGGEIQNVFGNANTQATIQWDASEGGALSITITYANGTQTTATICVKKIISPAAKFDVVGSSDFYFCVDTPINFENYSNDNGGSDIVNYLWDFGDGTTSSLFEPTHTYDTPGIYSVVLTVTNSCNCTSYDKREIYISSKPNVDISCPSVVCEGDIATYTANDECGGEWEVTGGQIISQDGHSVKVRWDNVDPEDGFGYVRYLSKCACPYWTIVKVPVILKNAKIKGNSTICLNKQEKFTLPQWPSTDFVWKLNGNPNHPMLVFTDQRNEIIVSGLQQGEYQLTCEYRNTLLGCDGRAEMKLKVVNVVEINGDYTQPVCAGTSIQFTNNQGAAVQWEISLNNTIVHTQNGITCTYTFLVGGSYSIVAKNGSCSSNPVALTVISSPNTPQGTIQGDAYYCLNTPVVYSVTANTQPNTVYAWEIIPATAGSIQGSNSGNQVTVIFTANNATVRVKRISTLGQVCSSGYVTKAVQKVTHNALVTHPQNQSNFCPSSVTTFNANLQGVVYDNLEWSIVGLGGATGETTNYGNIIGGINGSSVQVSFNEISSGVANGQLRLKVTKCGTTVTIPYNVTINQTPQLTINPVAAVCAGQNFTLSYTSSMPITSGTIKWTVNGDPFTGNTVTTTIDNISGANMSFPVTLEIVNPNGCNFTATTSTTVTIKPRPDIQVAGYNYSVCPTGTYSVTLQASLGSGINSGLTYQWYKNNIAIAPNGTGTSYIVNNNSQGTNPAGTYYVIVTNTATGCSTQTKNILVTHNCTTTEPCSVNETANFDLAVTKWSSCNRIDAKIIASGTPTYSWVAPPQVQAYNTTTATPYFTTNVPGSYLLIAKMNYNGCILQKQIEVKKHYQANFNYTLSCNANGTYTAQLLNNSVFFDYTPTSSTYSYATTGGTLVQNGPLNQNATVTNLQAGQSYTFTLTINGSGGLPVCTKTVTVSIPVAPNVNFTTPPAPYCPENGIVLTIPNYNSNYTYKWIFNGTAYIASGAQTTIQITTPGAKNIELIATNNYGCSFSHTITNAVNIPPVNFNGEHNEGYTICEGQAATPLTYTAAFGSTTPTGITWMKGNAAVGTGNSFTPTSSGSYWAKLHLGTCTSSDMAGSPVNVTIKPLPYVTITGQNNVCFGGQTTLYGTVTDSSLQHRWLRNGTAIAGALGTWVTGAANLQVPVTGNTPGTYTYRLEVQGGNSCANFKEFVVTVHPALPNISMNYTVLTCEPYVLKLTASGPSNGSYNWSNGATGQSINVTHGGAYAVTYTAPSGCTQMAHIQTPHNAERYLWVVPSGCYQVCPTATPAPYLLGPLGMQDAYKWLVNGNVVQSGANSSVPNLPVTVAGHYQLAVQNGSCAKLSPVANITYNPKDCEIAPCNFKFEIERMRYNALENYFLLVGHIVNTTTSTLTVNLSSFGHYGTFVPGTFTLAPGQMITFNTLRFYPNSSYPVQGANDYILLSTPNCTDLNLVKWEPLPSSLMDESSTPTTLSVHPNPATEAATVQYALGDTYKQAQRLVVYDLVGNVKHTEKLTANTGEVKLPVTYWNTGTYIISLEADNLKVASQKLIKK